MIVPPNPFALSLVEWLNERHANAQRIASDASRDKDDRDGWLEDAWYFKEAARISSAAPELLEALTALLNAPSGCAFCDFGKPRKSVRTGELCEHDEACGYVLARAAIAKATS